MQTTTITRLPRGSAFDGLKCPPLRALTPREANAQRRGRELLRFSSPEAQCWVELHLAQEARLWDLFEIQLP